MDQVPLSFAILQDATHTTENDQNAHISALIEALRKRQFTMCIFCNAGEREDRNSYAVLVYKESPNSQRTQIEKMSL